MRNLNIVVATVFAALLSGGCASKSSLQASPVVLGAEGEVRAEAAENDNTKVTIKVEHLAPAEKVDSTARNYIVWIQPTGQSDFQNLGALTVNGKLEGEYSTTTPHRNFRILVTPEASTTVATPSGVTIFDQTVSR